MMMSGANCPNEHDVPVMKREGGTGYKEYAPGTSNNLVGAWPPLPRGRSSVLAPYFLPVLFGTDSFGHALISSCSTLLEVHQSILSQGFPRCSAQLTEGSNPELASMEVLRIFLARSQASENQSQDANVAHCHISRRPRHHAQLSKESMGICFLPHPN